MAVIIVKIIWLSVVLTWYKPEYWAEAYRIEIVLDVGDCKSIDVCTDCILAGCYGRVSKTIHIDPSSSLIKDALLHESVHYFQYQEQLGFPFGFRQNALRHVPELSHLPSFEVHAQLPNVLGFIPDDLQEWYPWLRKERQE